MAAGKFDLKELERRMRGAIDTLKKEFGGLAHRAAPACICSIPVVVNVYGARMPINQVATVSTPDARTISVQVWDKGQVGAVEKAIREANLGLNPVIDGALLRLPIPRSTPSGARSSSRWPTSMPSRPAWRCATCAARAWICSRSSTRTAR